MESAALHMSSAARALRAINDVMRERSSAGTIYDEVVASMTTEEREAFVELHEALNALHVEAQIFRAGSWK